MRLLSNYDGYVGESLVGLHPLIRFANVAQWKGIAMIVFQIAFCEILRNNPVSNSRVSAVF